VPFNAHVNPGGASSWTNDWADEDAEAYYHGARFFHVNDTGDSNGDGVVDITFDSQYGGSERPGGVAHVIDVDRKVNHFDLYNSLEDGEWFGCVEARPYPLDELDTPPGGSLASNVITTAYASLSSSAEPDARMRSAFQRAPNPVLSVNELAAAENSRWVPYFYPDEPDCPQGSGVCRGSWSNATDTYTLNGVARTLRTTDFMFDNPDGFNGYDDDAYDNHDFVNDFDFTHRNSTAGDAFERYAEVVIASRYVGRAPYSHLNNYWDGVKERFEELDFNNFGQDEYKIRIAYPGYWDETLERYIGRYDSTIDVDIDETTTQRRRGPNRDCPAPILPMTSLRTAIEDHMDTLVPRGNTNSANGAVWGWRVLSNQAPFTEGVPSSDGQWQKAVVIMTDGVNVVNSDNADTHWDSVMTAYGFALEERMGQGVDRPARGGGGFDNDRMADHIDEKLLRICRRMKQEGILVYTIVFGLNDNNLENVFKSCATDREAPYYYKAPTATDLETAFSDIASDLVKLHISQ
ncbi:MAG: hypothetical protein AAGJ87_13905, partial [Pseudomonadota bacterium]